MLAEMRQVLSRHGPRKVLASVRTSVRNANSGRSALATSLLKTIFAIYFGITLLITAVQMSLQFGEERAKLQAEITAAIELVQPALAVALWDFDKNGTNAIILGLSHLQSVAGVSLEGAIPMTVGVIATKNGAPLSKLYEQKFIIYRSESAGKVGTSGGGAIGTIKIYVDARTVLSRAMNVFVTIFVSAAIKTLALWLILYFVIKVMVAAPLVRLSKELDRLDDEHNEEPPLLRHRHRPKSDTTADELAALFRSFISMRRALRRSQKRLLAQHGELERKVEERTHELHHQAMHDALTGLLNRRAFENRMTSLMSHQKGAEVPSVLCLIDLDHFKQVNDTFGHSGGDQVLKQVAGILKRNTRPIDTVARMGGDEFAIILVDCNVNDGQSKIQQLVDEVEALQLHKDGQRIPIGLSAGLVALPSQPNSDLHQTMVQADQACYDAKNAGRHQVKIFGEAAGTARRKTDINWVRIITLALAENRLMLYAQPLFCRSSQSIRRLEIDVRLQSDSSPEAARDFLGVAEKYGLLGKIDAWVVTHVLAFLQAHPALLQQLDQVHINLSAASISDAGFYRSVVRDLKRHDVSPAQICFEISAPDPSTNAAYLAQSERMARIMKSLRRRGVSFALEAFGLGLSSYRQLQTLPINIVKIDATLVRSLFDDPLNCALVESIHAIANLAGMRTVAESVDNSKTIDKLTGIGIEYLQGSVVGAAVPLSTLAAQLSVRTDMSLLTG